MLDQGVSDEKVLAFAAGDPRFAGIADFAAVQPHLLKEIEHFFSVYKALEGKQTHVQGWGSADEARGDDQRMPRKIPQQERMRPTDTVAR